MSYSFSDEIIEMQKTTQEHIHISRTAGVLTLNPMQRFLIKEAKEIFKTSLNIIEENQNQNQNQTYRIKQLVSFNEELVSFIARLSAEYNQKKTKQYINCLNDFWSRLTHINSLKEKTPNNLKDNGGLTLNKPTAISRVNVFDKSVTVPYHIQFLSYINKHSTELFFKSVGVAFILWILSAIYHMVVNTQEYNEFNEKITAVSSVPRNINTMMENNFFTSQTFRDYVILLEKTNQQKPLDEQWKISFNADKRFVFLNKDNFSQDSCKTMVALKEISFDSAAMKVNGINLPMNYWTASDSKGWTQSINQNLCSLNKNSIQIALGGHQVRKNDYYIKNLKTTNHNFYIREHNIALKYNNSEVVDKALRERINFFQQLVDNKKQ